VATRNSVRIALIEVTRLEQPPLVASVVLSLLYSLRFIDPVADHTAIANVTRDFSGFWQLADEQARSRNLRRHPLPIRFGCQPERLRESA
jgi:hypothetical protein